MPEWGREPRFVAKPELLERVHDWGPSVGQARLPYAARVRERTVRGLGKGSEAIERPERGRSRVRNLLLRLEKLREFELPNPLDASRAPHNKGPAS